MSDDELLIDLGTACGANCLMQWCVERAGELERIDVAWHTTSSQYTMRRLLHYALGYDDASALPWCDAPHCHGWTRDPCAACCDALRRTFPTMTIGMVAEAHARRMRA